MITVRQFDFGTPEYDESVKLRDDILRKPLGLEFKIEDLEKEYNSLHIGAYDPQGRLMGCLILKPLTAEIYKMRQVAVAENLQGQGVGKLLVSASEQLLKSMSASKIELNARDVAIPFYLKLDYQKVGEEFVEVGIPHFKMEKNL